MEKKTADPWSSHARSICSDANVADGSDVLADEEVAADRLKEIVEGEELTLAKFVHGMDVDELGSLGSCQLQEEVV